MTMWLIGSCASKFDVACWLVVASMALVVYVRRCGSSACARLSLMLPAGWLLRLCLTLSMCLDFVVFVAIARHDVNMLCARRARGLAVRH